MSTASTSKDNDHEIGSLDDELSKRFIALDPSGYFLVKVDLYRKEIVVEHYSNDLDDLGRAIDPKTGEILACKGSGPRKPLTVFRAKSAKHMGIQLSEGEPPYPISKIDHAMYMGRELQRAEACLKSGSEYIQD